MSNIVETERRNPVMANVKCCKCEAVADVLDTSNYAGEYYCEMCSREKGWKTNREVRAAVCAITGKSMGLSVEEQLADLEPTERLEVLKKAGLAQ